PLLRDFADAHYSDSRNDLANMFLERCIELAVAGAGVAQVVMPQNWLFQATGEAQRTALLKEKRCLLLARLGSGAFETISGEVVNVVLLSVANAQPTADAVLHGLDCSTCRSAMDKASSLATDEVVGVPQSCLLKNPRAVVTFDDLNVSVPRLGN